MNYCKRFLPLLLLISLLGIYLPVPTQAEEICLFTEKMVDTTPDDLKYVYTTDVDGDGDVDILSASFGDTTIAWYENDGAENFTKRIIDDAKPSAFSVAAADFDGDDDIDIVSSGASTSPLTWYRNDGSENFTKILLPSQPVSVLHVTTVDFDGDDDIDILAPASVSDTVYWYENDGSATFTRHTIGTQDGPESAHAVDIDGDDDLDVLVESWADNTVAWYENDGTSLSFTKNVVDSTTDVAQYIYGTDLDNDGDIDILVPVVGSSGTIWYQNDGSETFTKKTISASDGPPRYPVDINSDGDTDVITSPFGVYNNDGSGNFTLDSLSDTVVARAYATDIDGNGKIDIVIGSDDDSIRILMQNCSTIETATSSATDTSLNVSITIDQADPLMNDLTVVEDVPYTLSSKLPDYDQVQEAYFRVLGNKYFFSPSENPGYFTLLLPDLPLGEHLFAFTADWGRTTRTIHGTITITPKPRFSPLLPLINSLFRLSYGREITVSEWQYWAERILNMEKISLPSVFGAMQWQSLFGS